MTENKGFYVDSRRVALAFTPSQALTATGVAVGLVALSPQLAVSLAVYEDAGGLPSGRQLAEVAVTVARAGKMQWITGRFAAPTPLGMQQAWLVVRAESEACVWLATSGEDADTSVARVLVQSDPRAAWIPAATQPLAGLAYRVISPAVIDVEDGSVAGNTASIDVWLAGIRVEPATQNGDGRVYDLTAALSAYLEGEPAPADDGLVHVPLAVHALGLRQATVYPPRLEFTLH